MSNALNDVLAKLDKLKGLATHDAILYVEDELRRRNQLLTDEINSLKEKILFNELTLGMIQFKTPLSVSKTEVIELGNAPAVNQCVLTPNLAPSQSDFKVRDAHLSTKNLDKNKSTSVEKAQPINPPIHVGRLDMRVGRIVEVSYHPDADSLYVEKVDFGDGHFRTVVSGLVKYVPLEDLKNRIGIFLCNLKPAKMRGVESEAMLMCASAPEAGKVEPLIIESDNIALGDSVIVPGYECVPDAQLNPKKKIFELVKPDLRVSKEGVAAYIGVPWTLKRCPGAIIKAPTMTDVQIA